MPNPEFEELARAVMGLLGSGAPPAAVHAQAEPTLTSTVSKASGSPPAHKGRPAAETPVKGKPSNGISSSALAFIRRPMALLGALALACVIGLGWYFASRPHPTGPAVTPAAPAPQKPAAGEVKVKVNPKDNQRYVWIPPGKFMMGCSPGDSECYDDEKPAHEVSISHGFWMGQAEVTQAAYKAVTGKPNPSSFKGDDLPVEQVTWEDARSYREAVGMRLPTEAEWEYAARAGSTAAHYGSLDELAWYSGNNEGKTHPVARKSPNAWGLYDMLGNVWEWCSDWYGKYSEGEQDNPTGPSMGEEKIVRGGSWSDLPRIVRVSFRIRNKPSKRYDNIGFRCGGELR